MAGVGLTSKSALELQGKQLSTVDVVATLLTLAPEDAPTESSWLKAIATVVPALPTPHSSAPGAGAESGAGAGGPLQTCPGGAAADGRACPATWGELMERSYIEVTAPTGASADTVSTSHVYTVRTSHVYFRT